MSGFSTSEDVSLHKNVEDCDSIQETKLEDVEELYEIQKCSDWINTNKFVTVCLQFPDKLLIDTSQILLQLKQKVTSKLYILGDTSYGSCCVDEIAAEHVKSDAIIHYGHACLSSSKRLPVLYIFDKKSLNVDKFITEWKSSFRDVKTKVVLFYDVKYYHCIGKIAEYLKDYENLMISQLALNDLSGKHALGRCFNEPLQDDFKYVYIGSDDQSFFNLSVTYNLKECLVYDDDKFKHVSPVDSRWLKRRMYLVEKCKDAKTVGILICTLALNGYLEAIEYIQKLCKDWNKKSYIISVGKPNSAKLANFPEIDIFVLISCPENTIYNDRDFYKPIITVFELDLALNPSRTRDDVSYIVDFPQLLPNGTFFKAYDTKHLKINDISLVTGQVRILSTEDNISSSSTNAVGLCSNKDLVLKDSALSERSWTGLEQKLGETQPQLAVPGRRGVPMSYSEMLPNK
ncbi:2-(3-amino-3-carboxypropyl)histidine synthase subunit 2 [Ctenocephalides felis]|uniref:2-(3-amino-3-carboxypropyl)histidine synthase subunit 2 n=1 Tax=Ctenocephalides felis TaxID=7515 RepID=UPI000E6E16F2|nr:2-(3-amino-3-carboxypropyl)histidine synthase subunit 2 [Ctenocephalides felis]